MTEAKTVSRLGSGVLGLPKTYMPTQDFKEFPSAAVRRSLTDKLTGAPTGLPRDDKPKKYPQSAPSGLPRDDMLSKNTFLLMMHASTEISRPKKSLQKDKDSEKKAAIVASAPPELEGEILTHFQILAEKWKQRSKVRMSLSSLEYQRLQGRFLFLGVPPELFEDQRDEAQWSYVTAHAYFTAGLAAIQAAEVLVSPQLKLQAKLLSILAKEEDPRRQTIPARAEHIKAAVCKLCHSAALALEVTYVLGQRLGDVFKLVPQNISTITDEISKQTLTTVMFKKGKTIKRTQPYCLHLDGVLGQSLLKFSKERMLEQQLFQFEDFEAIRDAIKATSPELNILSIRRGGLQAMAQRGISIETILHHSRHTTQDTLMRYLDWGQVNLAHIRELQSNPQSTSSEWTQRYQKRGRSL